MSNGVDRRTVPLGTGESFDTVVVPHLDAAHRLARWLMRDEHDAQDVVQEASLRAFQYFRTFVGGDEDGSDSRPARTLKTTTNQSSRKGAR